MHFNYYNELKVGRLCEALKAEIEKGWSGATSKRNINDIFNEKRQQERK